VVLQELVIDTSTGANELSYLNDYRPDVGKKRRGVGQKGEEVEDAAAAAEANVEPIEVVDMSGKPHILYVVVKDVAKGEELLTDYGEQVSEHTASVTHHGHSRGCSSVRLTAPTLL
jgi:SET domain-containing protein